MLIHLSFNANNAPDTDVVEAVHLPYYDYHFNLFITDQGLVNRGSKPTEYTNILYLKKHLIYNLILF